MIPRKKLRIDHIEYDIPKKINQVFKKMNQTINDKTRGSDDSDDEELYKEQQSVERNDWSKVTNG